MRKQDLEVGSAYAVVASRGGYCELHAFRGTVVAAGQHPGCWLVRFDEPLVVRYGTLKTVAAEPGERGSAFLEQELSSHCILAPWSEFARKRDSDAEEEERTQERNEQEEGLLQQSLIAVRAALAECGQDPGGFSFYTQTQGLGAERVRYAHASLSPQVAAFLASAVEQAPIPESALQELLGDVS